MSAVLGAALAGQMWFSVRQGGDTLTLAPVARLSRDCACALLLDVQRSGGQGNSISRQRRKINLSAQRPAVLASMSFSLPVDGSLRVTVTLNDERGRRLVRQWAFSSASLTQVSAFPIATSAN